jgi:ketosteroid isomerase-like protein
MSEAENRRAIDRFVEQINAGNPAVMDELFANDAVTVYPQSGEVIRGKANLHSVYAVATGLPTIAPYRTTSGGDLVVTEALLDYGNGDTYNTIFVFEFRGGKIARHTSYWSKPFPAPEWRAPWVTVEQPGA